MCRSLLEVEITNLCPTGNGRFWSKTRPQGFFKASRSALRRGLENSENAVLGQKMSFPVGH